MYEQVIFPSFRKQWVKRQKIVHNYGDEEELEDSEEFQAELDQHMRDGTVSHHIPAVVNKPDNVDVVLGGKRCKCGSMPHLRISHSHCPLNIKRQSV